MRLKLVVIFSGVLLLLPYLAQAQVKFGGGLRGGILGYNQNEIDAHHFFWGLQGRVRLVKFLGAELSYQKRTDNFNFRNGNIELQTRPIQLSGFFYPLGMFPVSPYFVGGTGWYHFDITVTGDLNLPYVSGQGTFSLSENATHIGVGVEGFIGDHFSVGADVRKIFLTVHNPLITNLRFNAYFVNFMANFYF